MSWWTKFTNGCVWLFGASKKGYEKYQELPEEDKEKIKKNVKKAVEKIMDKDDD